MSKSKAEKEEQESKQPSLSDTSLINSTDDPNSKIRNLLARSCRPADPLKQVLVCKRLAKMPKIFLAKRREMRQIAAMSSDLVYNDDIAGIRAVSYSPSNSITIIGQTRPPTTFDEYTEQLEAALVILRNMTIEEYESETALKVLRFLEHLIDQPKEWISGAKLKLSELRFPEMAMVLMRSYKEKGYLVRRIVFVHSILLYNSMGNFTDHEFDREGLIRKQSAEAGFIEFACEVLKTVSYRESLNKCYIIRKPEEILFSDDFDNFQKILYICDAALTILYNMANLPELKIYFRECNAISVIAEYTKLSSETIDVEFHENDENQEALISLKELQDIISAIRVTSSLLLTLIINEDEDNLLTMNASEIFPLLSGMIQMYNRKNQRFYGFSLIELVDGLSKLMVRGRTFMYVDQNLVDILLGILENLNHEDALLECVSNAILNASFDQKVQQFLRKDRAVNIVTKARDKSQSLLIRKNCEAILWTVNMNHIRHISQEDQISSQNHIMISYNHSALAMCLKIRDRLKALNYTIWLDVYNINGGVLESMAQAIEKSFVVLICMNEQYKQSHYCRLEAEYATELRKPCIPCLMQPRFQPYGWLGIIKGAKIHVDFSILPFEEAFSLLVREIETIRHDTTNIPTSQTNSHIDDSSKNEILLSMTKPTLSNQSPLTSDRISSTSQQHTSVTLQSNPISSWTSTFVSNWINSIGLGPLDRIFSKMDGKTLWQLYRMKLSVPTTYYNLLDKHFDRTKLATMDDMLRFDYELEQLFNSK